MWTFCSSGVMEAFGTHLAAFKETPRVKVPPETWRIGSSYSKRVVAVRFRCEYSPTHLYQRPRASSGVVSSKRNTGGVKILMIFATAVVGLDSPRSSDASVCLHV